MKRLFTHSILIYGKEPYWFTLPFVGSLFMSISYPGGTHNLLGGEQVVIPKLNPGDQLMFTVSVQTPEDLQPKPKKVKTKTVKFLEWLIKKCG